MRRIRAAIRTGRISGRFSVADDAITEIGEVAISVTDATRVLRAGDLLYVTSPGGCTVVQSSDGQSVGQADIAVG